MATTPAKPATAAKPAAKRAPAKRSAKKGQSIELPENHTESEAVAHSIVVKHIDLMPSVNRIMQSELGEPGRLVAITLFRDSLGVPGDPNRDPAIAIEQGRATEGEA